MAMFNSFLLVYQRVNHPAIGVHMTFGNRGQRQRPRPRTQAANVPSSFECGHVLLRKAGAFWVSRSPQVHPFKEPKKKDVLLGISPTNSGDIWGSQKTHGMSSHDAEIFGMAT